MRDRDRLRRSNIVLVGLVLLMLLYGVLSRAQSGDRSLYIFGFKVDLPFATQQEAAEEPSEEAPSEEAPSEELGK